MGGNPMGGGYSGNPASRVMTSQEFSSISGAFSLVTILMITATMRRKRIIAVNAARRFLRKRFMVSGLLKLKNDDKRRLKIMNKFVMLDLTNTINHMRKIKLYIAMSLNGKIARANGSVDWLELIPNPDQLDYGYSDFYDSIDTTIQGFTTYNQIISWGIDYPYADKKNFVLSTKQNLTDTEYVEFISNNHFEFIRNLKKQMGKDIWLIGGGKLNSTMLNEQLIDEIQLFIMPIIIPDGIELFDLLPKENQLKLIETKSYSTGVVKLIYTLNY
jgi:dihydrofolate reductase